jgi:hypothetical protein
MVPDRENQPNIEGEMEQLIDANPIVHSIAVSPGNINLLSPTAQDVFDQDLINHYNNMVDIYFAHIVITETLRHEEIDPYEPLSVRELWELNIRITDERGFCSDHFLTYTHIIGSPIRNTYQYM